MKPKTFGTSPSVMFDHKRSTCYICKKPVTQSKAFGYDPIKGYYHSECFYGCDDCHLDFTSRSADYCGDCKNKKEVLGYDL